MSMASRTVLGPLTTKWEYPSRCTHAVIKCSTCDEAWQAQSCGNNGANSQGVLDDTDCWPPVGTANPIAAGFALKGWGFYSPAFDCPTGYGAACTATGTVAATGTVTESSNVVETGTATQSGSSTEDFEFQFSIRSNENVIGCCPLGYTCANLGGVQTCTSLATRGTVEVAACATGRTIRYSLTLPTTFTDKTQTGTLDEVTMFAPMFQLNWRESDLPLSTSDRTIPTLGPVPYRPSSGLSTGAKAGIGVGAGAVVLGLIGAAFLLGRRRRRNKVTEAAKSDTHDVKPTAELAGTPSPSPPQYHQGVTPTPVELDGTPSRHEMSGTTATQEMPATEARHGV